MVKIFLLILSSLFLSACSLKKPTPLKLPPSPPPKTIVGGDQDEHGCIASAGYLWCGPQQKCLRPWEDECLHEINQIQLQFSDAKFDPPYSSIFPWNQETGNQLNLDGFTLYLSNPPKELAKRIETQLKHDGFTVSPKNVSDQVVGLQNQNTVCLIQEGIMWTEDQTENNGETSYFNLTCGYLEN